MDMSLNENSDRPYDQDTRKTVNVYIVDQSEHEAVTILKLFALVLFTYGLVVVMWLISTAIEQMENRSVIDSYVDGGGLMLGLFCFYVLAFGGAWCWGFRQRDELKRKVVEEQIARQKAMDALNNIE